MSRTNNNCQLLYLIGFQRSGTTLLCHLLDKHPEIVCAEEPEVSKRIVFGQIKELVDSGFDSIRKNLEFYNADRKEYGTLADRYVSGELDEDLFLRSVYGLFNRKAAKLAGAKEVCDLSSFKYDYIRKLISFHKGNAKFIFIERDIKGVVNSFKKIGWFPPGKRRISNYNLKKFAKSYLKCVNDADDRLSYCNTHYLTFENLFLNPKKELAKIFEFLEVDSSPEALNTIIHTPSEGLRISYRNFDEKQVIGWKDNLNKKNIEWLNNLYFQKRERTFLSRNNNLPSETDENALIRHYSDRVWQIMQYFSFIKKRIRNNASLIGKLLEEERILSYDPETHIFRINDSSIGRDDRAILRRTFIRTTRKIMPNHFIKLKDIKTGYYDQCLERYLYERINLNKPNEETCWFKLAQTSKCIGKVAPDNPFGQKEKLEFCGQFLKTRATFRQITDLSEKLAKDSEGYIFLQTTEVYTNDDPTLNLCMEIEQKGFSNIISSLAPIILGYSTKTGFHSVISGRHRIGALKYLASQDKISKDIKIRCHVLEYPFDSLVYTRPYSDICKKCIPEKPAV